MKNMEYKLICTDIDGTLLNDEKKLPLRAKQSLQAAVESGIAIALVSGRMPSGVNLVEKELGISCIKVCNAGTCIFVGETCMQAEYLSNETMRRLYRTIAKTYRIPLWIFRNQEWFVTGWDDYIEKETGFVAYHPRIVDADALADQWDREGKSPNKLLFAAPSEVIQNICQEITVQKDMEIDTAKSADIFLEIFPKGVSKGTALKQICKLLRIQPEETIAFGDHELDIPLIEAAGIGVAMGNGISALKEKADLITGTNNEAGIADALEKILEKAFL